MEVLLEVVLEREVDERPAVGGQLHRRGQPALDDRQVAGRQVAIEVVDVADDLEALVARQRLGIDARAGDDDRPQPRNPRGGERMRVDHPAQQMPADAGPADADDAHPLGRRGSRARRAAPRGRANARRIETGDVAGEVEVLLGPLADRGQLGPKPVGDDVVGIADEDRPVAQRAGSARCARPSRRCSRRSGTPRARRRRASAASRRSRSASSTRRA